MPRGRFSLVNGNLTIRTLRQEDFGFYECIVSNEIATIISGTQLVVEGTVPHAPHNITTETTEYSITIAWLPGYSGGSTYNQEYAIW